MSHYHATDTGRQGPWVLQKIPASNNYFTFRVGQICNLVKCHRFLRADYLCDGNNFTLAQVYCHNFHVTLIYVHNNLTLNIMSPCILRDPPSEL